MRVVFFYLPRLWKVDSSPMLDEYNCVGRKLTLSMQKEMGG